MADDPSDKRSLVVQNANVRVTVTYTRRTLLAGAAAATAAATVATLSTPPPARAADANSAQDMTDFITLSAALTGIMATKLAPAADPIDIKRDYFKLLNEKQPAAFDKLLTIVRDNRNAPAQTIIDKVQSDAESKFLARSIVLMWYLGAWYDPGELKMLTEPIPKDGSGASRRRIPWARATCSSAIGSASPIQNVPTSLEVRDGRRMQTL